MNIDDKEKYTDVEPGFSLKDSGERQNFETGSRRDTREGKGRFDLIPQYPLLRLAQLMERGAVKYGERNWELGQPLMRYLDSAARHVSNLLDGELTEDHAIQAVFNLFGYVHTLNEIEAGRLPAELDDRPERMRVEGKLKKAHRPLVGDHAPTPSSCWCWAVSPKSAAEIGDYAPVGCDPLDCSGDCGVHDPALGAL